MGDKATLAKAKKELEDLYLGVPDESVNLTFQDFAQQKKKFSPPPPPIETISEKSASPLAKLPSLDFSRGLEAASFQRTSNSHHHHHRVEEGPGGGHHAYGHDHRHDDHDVRHGAGNERSMVYDDMSGVTTPGYGGGRRRPGIPHSNICTVCSNYIYIFRHRCLVCGRLYCRQCVSTGMGEMTEGRKCVECLGRRFSQRYIDKAGSVGCCMGMGYPSVVKQQELKWAEKGPRRSVMMSTSRSPATPTTQHSPTNPPSTSFVITSPYSPYSPKNHHPMPF